MTNHLGRIIPKRTDDTVVSIPPEAWDPVRDIADEFDAVLRVHDHEMPGAYHGNDYVPVAHYLVELEVDSSVVFDLLTRIDPLVEDIIAAHTTINIPAAA